MNFYEKVQAIQQRSGLSYHQCCRRLGAAGGRATARNKVRRRNAIAGEQARLERMHLL